MKYGMAKLAGCLMLLVAGIASAQGDANFSIDKKFSELTPAEKTAAKEAALHQPMRPLVACADPANMPFSDRNGDGIDNRIVEVLAKAMHTTVSFYWMSYISEHFLSRAFGTPAEPLGHCDLLVDVPVDYSGVLMSEPIYRSTYVLAYRADRGIHVASLADPALRKLRVGVYQTSAVREALAENGLKNGVQILTVSHDTEGNPEAEQWRQVERMVDGKLDVVGVWGPFAGYVKTAKHAPIVLQPVNLMSDRVQLEFTMGIGVRETDAVLKYALDNALDASAAQITAILKEYGVPLVRCSECVVAGDLPSHGPYTTGADAYARYLQPLDPNDVHVDAALAAPHEIVTVQDAQRQLAAGADPDAELAGAVLASDGARIRFLAAHGAHLDRRDSMGSTPLITAISARDSATAALLLELGANANAPDGAGMTPLMEAAYRDHVPSVEVLLKHGASLTATTRDGLTPLCVALNARAFQAASALVKGGASPNVACGTNRLTPLMIVATHEKADTSGNVPVDGGQFLSDGMSPLEIGKLLVDKGADVNARGRGGVTALMIAAGYDNGPLVGLLVQAGAQVDARSDAGKTALDIAKDNGSDTAASTLELMAKFAPRPASPAAAHGRP